MPSIESKLLKGTYVSSWSADCYRVHPRMEVIMDTVLIADRDLGFVFWLGQALGAVGYQSLPAITVPQAAALAERFPVDVLVANPSLPDMLAFIKSLYRAQGHLKVIILPTTIEARLEKFSNPLAAIREAQDGADFL